MKNVCVFAFALVMAVIIVGYVILTAKGYDAGGLLFLGFLTLIGWDCDG